jgi:hypothetical protein
MPVHTSDGRVTLEGHCTIEEAESLCSALQAMEEPIFDCAETKSLHTAILQLILISGGKVRSLPSDPVLAACLKERLA